MTAHYSDECPDYDEATDEIAFDAHEVTCWPCREAFGMEEA